MVQDASLWTEASEKDFLITADHGNEHDETSPWADDNRASDHIVEINNAEFSNPFASDVHSRDDPVSQFIDYVRTSENQSTDDPPEMYLPGFF